MNLRQGRGERKTSLSTATPKAGPRHGSEGGRVTASTPRTLVRAGSTSASAADAALKAKSEHNSTTAACVWARRCLPGAPAADVHRERARSGIKRRVGWEMVAPKKDPRLLGIPR